MSYTVAFFVFGIFMHNLLEGLTLGVQTNKSSAISLFTAIMLHGFPLATAVTAALLKHWMPLGLALSTMALYLSLICFIRPLGIILGIFVVHVPGIAALIIAAAMQVNNHLGFSLKLACRPMAFGQQPSAMNA